jgi:hypothetical protein
LGCGQRVTCAGGNARKIDLTLLMSLAVLGAVMHKVTCPTRLAEANWHIAKTRECIARQKALVEAMKREKRDVSGCRELLALSQGVLRLMLARRKFISWALSVCAQ